MGDNRFLIIWIGAITGIVSWLYASSHFLDDYEECVQELDQATTLVDAIEIIEVKYKD